MARYLLALDQGTTSSRAILFDAAGAAVYTAQKETTQIYPQSGWVEQDPMEIYSSQYSVAVEAITASGIDPDDIAAIGITNQRETTIVWDRHTGKPVYNAIVWQCRRTAPICEQLCYDGYKDYIRETTGLVVDAYFSGSKIKWILDNVPGARERAEAGDLLFGTVDTWLLWKLTEGRVHATDYTNASRTMLFDIHKLDWDEKLLNALDIPKSLLPKVYKSAHHYGICNLCGADIPIGGMAGDQQAALFGQTCFEKGEGKNTYGTGCFLLCNTGSEAVDSKNGLVTTLAATDDEVQYVLEGSVFIGGAVMQWLRDEMKMITTAAEAGQIAASVSDNGGVYLVPAFAGLGAPHWDMYARGTIVGLTRGSGRAHIVRAAEECIAYQSMELLDAINADLGAPMSSLRADGGASRDKFLMQFQADVLNIPVVLPQNKETTALGAAFLAGLTVGVYADKQDIKRRVAPAEVYNPQMDSDTRNALKKGWYRAVQRALAWEEVKI